MTTRSRWFKERERELREIVWDWDPMGLVGPPDDEYDFLIHRVLGELVRGADQEVIADAMGDEMNKAFGPAPNPDSGDRSFASQVLDWYRRAPAPPGV